MPYAFAPRFALILAPLLLVGCGSAEDEAGDAGGQTEPAPAQTAIPVEPDGGIGDGAPPPGGELSAVPEPFRGVWDTAQGSCNPNSDLRVEIGSNSFRFYESTGEVTGIRADGADAIVVEFAMEGEGERWTMRRRFTLSDGGERLTPTAVDPDEAFEPMPLRKCED